MKSLSLLPALGAVLCATALHADTIYNSSAAFLAATTNDTVVTFGTATYSPNGFATASTPGHSFTAGALTIGSTTSTLNINNANYYNTNGGYPVYPNGNYVVALGNTPTDAVTIQLPASTAFAISLGGIFKTTSGENIGVVLSDGSTGSLTTSAYVTSGNPLQFYGFTSSQAITSITLTFQDDGSSHIGAFDTIIYGTALTPEPSSFALLGTGLLGAIGAARRRWRS